jgi:serine/threonine protein phosphatase PrpC/outer membrane biosynthesis protein TonB
MNTSIYNADFVSIHGLTDPGRSGKNNEDSWDRFSILVPDGSGTETMQPAELIVVADGIGGARGGEVASSLAVQEIMKAMEGERTPKRSIEQRLDAAISAANQVIYERSAKDPDLLGMGTTVLAVVLTQKRRCYIAHAGDSRAYLIRGNRIHLLTQDHTRVQEMVDMGRITLAEAKDHPNRHVVSRFVGINDTVPVDLNLLQYSERGDEKAVKALYIDLQPGDTLLCCSDGLNDMLDDDEILEVVRRYGIQNGPTELVKAANLKGGDDNITAVIASVLGVGGVAVTPPAGRRTFPLVPIMAALLFLVLGGGALYWALTGGFASGVMAENGGVLTPTAESGVAGAITETPVAAVGSTEGTPDAPTATPDASQGVVNVELTPNSTVNPSLPTSTRLVPPTATYTNTPVPPTATVPRPPTNTPRPTTPGQTPNPGATQAPAPTRTTTSPDVPPPTGRTAVVLTNPAPSDSFAQGNPVTFSWQGQVLGGGESYNLKIWKQSSPNTIERETLTSNTSVTIQGLNPETYQWSVQISGNNGPVAGTLSNPRIFSVTGGGDTPDPNPPTSEPEPTSPPATVAPTLPPRDTPIPEPTETEPPPPRPNEQPLRLQGTTKAFGVFDTSKATVEVNS